MKNTIKTLLLFFTAAILITSCSDDDKNPPTAGFSMSNMEPVQWGTSTIASTAIAADEISYTVTGGEFVWVDAATIQFLDDNSYTITQTVVNADGTDTSAITVDVAEPANMYTLDGEELTLTAEPEWIPGNPAHGTTDLLKFKADVSGQDFPNHINLSPILGPNPIEGTYTYDGDGEAIGTYLARVVSNYEGGFNPSDWTTDFSGSDGGSNLVIKIVYEDTNEPAHNVYDITITDYTLSTGYYDFAAGFVFVEVAKKTFTLNYRGVIVYPVAP